MARLDRSRPADNRGKHSTQPSPDHIPPIPKELVEYLDKAFPNALPPEGTNSDEMWAVWGTRRVVDHLWEAHRQQQEQEEDLPNVLRQL